MYQICDVITFLSIAYASFYSVWLELRASFAYDSFDGSETGGGVGRERGFKNFIVHGRVSLVNELWKEGPLSGTIDVRKFACEGLFT